MKWWIAALGAAVIAGAATAAGAQLAAKPPIANPPAGDPQAGGRIIKQYCATCHGPLGRGASGPSFVGSTWRHGFYDAELARSIRDGYPNLGMPAWGGVLSDRQIDDVIAFIRKNPLPGTAAKGPNELNLPPAPFPTGVVRTAQESYRLEKLAKVERPYALAFLPDGRILVTQTNGRLRVIERGRLLAEPVADTPQGAAPQEAFQRRMLDVAAHPDFRTNGWIYLSWTLQEPGLQGADGVRLVLSRGRIRDGRWVDNQELLRVATPLATAGRIAFDGEGHVFLTVMDADWVDKPEQGIAPPQDLAKPMGKVLRLNDGGGAPADNPFVGRAGAYPYIWSLGHRTPMGLAFDGRGRLWEVENGPHGGDELNLIKPGKNYGWPTITWGLRYDDMRVASHAEQAGMEQPVINWSPTLAVAGIAFYTGDAFPHWKGDLLVSSMKARSLVRVVLNADGHAMLQETILFNLTRFRDVKTGPDGLIYLLAEDGDLMRLRPARR